MDNGIHGDMTQLMLTSGIFIGETNINCVSPNYQVSVGWEGGIGERGYMCTYS